MTLASVNIFTVDIDGRPTVVFDAASIDEARGICALPEFRADLDELTAGGEPICKKGAVLAARSASSSEISCFQHALALAVPSDGPTMAFLIQVDGVVISVVDPQHS